MDAGRPLFGGLDPDTLAALVTGGYASWVVTDADDRLAASAQAATVVEAPADVVFATCTDFESFPRFVSFSGPSQVEKIDEHRVDVHLRQEIGLAILKVGIDLHLRFRLEPNRAVRCERYLGGSFKHAVYEIDLVPLSDSRTLLVVTFFADLDSLGWLVKVFLSRVPELRMAIAANIGVVPVSAFGAEAQRRFGTGHRRGGPPPLTLWDAMEQGRLGPSLDRGLLTVGRLGSDREILDVATAGRIAAPPARVWPLVVDPVRRRGLVSVVDHGELHSHGPDWLDMEYGYKIVLGPLRKRYRIRASGPCEAPRRFVAERATTDGHPARYADYLVPDGEDTLLCHCYYSDLKQDWLSRRFLGSHPELERLIGNYPTLILVRALREHFGPVCAR